MSVLNLSEDMVECPLCMEPLEMDDLNFFPCTCGYQICRFCWHRIRTDENGLCPACRKAYPENPADFKPLSHEEWVCVCVWERLDERITVCVWKIGAFACERDSVCACVLIYIQYLLTCVQGFIIILFQAAANKAGEASEGCPAQAKGDGESQAPC